MCRAQWPLNLTYILRSFSHDFAINLLKYGTCCRFHSSACTVLDGFSPYLALMISSIRGCVALWPLTLTYIFDRSKVKVTQVVRMFAVWAKVINYCIHSRYNIVLSGNKTNRRLWNCLRPFICSFVKDLARAVPPQPSFRFNPFRDDSNWKHLTTP